MMQPVQADTNQGLGARLRGERPPTIPYNVREETLRATLQRELAQGDYPAQRAPCACGTVETEEVARWVWLGLEAPTVLCPHCGLVRSQPRLTAEASHRLRTRHLAAQEGAPDTAALRERERKKMGALLEGLLPRLDHPRTAVHVGAGAGGGLEALRAAGLTAYGVEARDDADVAPDLPALCERLDEPVDLVLVSGALDRSSDLEHDLAALRALVRPGGILWVRSRGLQTIGADYEGDLLRYLRFGDSWHFTEQTLRWVLRCNGFRALASDPQIEVTARRSDAETPRPPAEGQAEGVLRELMAAEKHMRSRAAPARRRRAPSAPSHPAERTFFCVGMAKTGTTLLARVIDQHPRVAVTSESYPFTPDNLGSLWNPDSGHYTVHGFSREQVTRWHSLWEAAAQDDALLDLSDWTGLPYTELYPFRKAMGEALASFAARKGATHAGDSWPYYLAKLPLVLQAFPRCKFIYNVRDPRAVWSSGQKWKGRGLGDKIMRDMLAGDQLLERARLGPRLFTLRYEDLIHEPEATMRALWSFLGVDYRPEYLRYSPDRDPYPKRWQVIANATAGFDPAMTRKWEQHIPDEKRREVEQVAAGFMKKYGYT